MSKCEELKKELLINPKSGRLTADEKTLAETDEFAKGYMEFLNKARTERLAVKAAVDMAEKRGFEEFNEQKKYKAGDKFYVNNRGKAAIFCVMGKEPVENGTMIAAAHIDSPRLDLKPNPLYEDNELALFKTHYYGGIKKYQWPTIPLCLFGVIIKSNGEKVEVAVGNKADDPLFVVTDLLPHLATEQVKRPAHEVIKGEELNILIGSHPFKDDKGSELVKLNIMKILNEKYGITEADFLSAELEAVPAFEARDIGFDRSMIGSYGHDDRVCAYPELMATLDTVLPEKTVVTIFADKEETGSDGNTGMNSSFLKYFMEDLALMQKTEGYKVLRNSKCLSADVNAAFDPTFASAFEAKNSAYLNYGAVITKYTGARGKSGTSDASAEYVGYIRNKLDKAGVDWQIGELGKVDGGGGGTVAMYIANLGVDVVDLGVPVLSMHAPFEVVAKYDVYMTYRTIYEFFN